MAVMEGLLKNEITNSNLLLQMNQDFGQKISVYYHFSIKLYIESTMYSVELIPQRF